MRKKMVIAALLVCSMIFGQVVWAGGKTEVQGNVQTAETTSDEQTETKDEKENQEIMEDKESDAENNVGTEEQQIAEQTSAEEINFVDKTAYVGHSFDIWDSRYDNTKSWSIESSDETICDGLTYASKKDYQTHIVIRAYKEGTANISVKCEGELLYAYRVTVKDLPEDSVCINDTNLIKSMKTQGVDVDDDGIVTKETMEKITELDIDYKNVSDLTGLECAVNMTEFSAYRNENLEDITPILKLEKLTNISLQRTNVSPEQRWQIAKIDSDVTVIKGSYQQVIKSEYVFESKDRPICEFDDAKYGEYGKYHDWGYLETKKEGIIMLHLSYHEYSKDVVVTVEGISADQEIGANYDTEITEGTESCLLDSAGNLWKMYPNPQIERKNVKKYVGGWIYANENETPRFGYALDSDDRLWSENNTLLAKNVKEYSGYYALDKDNVLKNIYNINTDSMENVKKYYEYQNRYPKSTTTYVLKNDGTLWRRKEVGKEQEINSFEKINDEIVDIDQKGYCLKATGEVIEIESGNIEITGAGSFINNPVNNWSDAGKYYVNKEGDTYIKKYIKNENYTEKWDSYRIDYINIGKVNIIQTLGREDMLDSPDEEGNTYEYRVYYLTDDGNLYQFVNDKPAELVEEDVTELSVQYDYIYKTKAGVWKTLDGRSGTMENPIVIYAETYELMDYGVAGDYNLERNGVLILTHVAQTWEDYYEGRECQFARRTDGTIWDITGVPKMILDLKTGAALMGDVNGDGEVNIQDLRIILRYVCGKEELDAGQQSVADVDANGSVDIQDLRKVLRFVCGKEAEL